MNPSTPRLQKFKKNDIVEAIQKIELDPRQFDLGENEKEAWIKHLPSGAFFTIGGNPGSYEGKYVSGDWAAWPYEAYSWEAVLRRISNWLDEVKRYIETPDLWEELQKETVLLGTIYNEDTKNTSFNFQEKKEIAEQLNRFVEHAKDKYSLSGTQLSDLNTKIEYLVEAANHLGRIDWRNAMVGVIMGYIITVALPPEVAHNMFIMLLHSITHIYGLHALSNP